MISRFIKVLFYTYVIGLAAYTTFQQLGHKRLGRLEETVTPPEARCEQGGEKWRYCVYSFAREDSSTYLYVFHGRGESEELWSDRSQYTAQLQNYWQAQGYAPPKVILVSFGPTWVLTPSMSQPSTGLLPLFRDEVFTRIESRLGAPKRRFLLGASMGGLNVLTLALHFPRQVQRVAAICPPLSEVSPRAPLHEVFAFAVANGAKLKSFLELWLVGRSLVATQEEWEQVSPLILAQKRSLNTFPPTYLSGGLRDEYGSYPALRQFAELLRAKAPQVQWRPSSGGHCAVDIPSLAEFLVRRN